jgi:predicted nucleotidyltransferase
MVEGPLAAPLPPEIRHALERYRAHLVAAFGERVRKVSLFGSWARREARPDSDVDVFVSIDRATWQDERLAAMLAADAAVETGVWLSTAVYSAERFRDEWARTRTLGHSQGFGGAAPLHRISKASSTASNGGSRTRSSPSTTWCTTQRSRSRCKTSMVERADRRSR